MAARTVAQRISGDKKRLSVSLSGAVMNIAAITMPSISVEKLRELDEIDLRAFTVPILIQGDDQDADLPVAVLVPYATFAAWTEEPS